MSWGMASKLSIFDPVIMISLQWKEFTDYCQWEIFLIKIQKRKLKKKPTFV